MIANYSRESIPETLDIHMLTGLRVTQYGVELVRSGLDIVESGWDAFTNVSRALMQGPQAWAWAKQNLEFLNRVGLSSALPWIFIIKGGTLFVSSFFDIRASWREENRPSALRGIKKYPRTLANCGITLAYFLMMLGSVLCTALILNPVTQTVSAGSFTLAMILVDIVIVCQEQRENKMLRDQLMHEIGQLNSSIIQLTDSAKQHDAQKTLSQSDELLNETPHWLLARITLLERNKKDSQLRLLNKERLQRWHYLTIAAIGFLALIILAVPALWTLAPPITIALTVCGLSLSILGGTLSIIRLMQKKENEDRYGEESSALEGYSDEAIIEFMDKKNKNAEIFSEKLVKNTLDRLDMLSDIELFCSAQFSAAAASNLLDQIDLIRVELIKINEDASLYSEPKVPYHKKTDKSKTTIGVPHSLPSSLPRLSQQLQNQDSAINKLLHDMHEVISSQGHFSELLRPSSTPTLARFHTSTPLHTTRNTRNQPPSHSSHSQPHPSPNAREHFTYPFTSPR